MKYAYLDQILPGLGPGFPHVTASVAGLVICFFLLKEVFYYQPTELCLARYVEGWLRNHLSRRADG